MSGAIDVVVDPEAGAIDVTVDADTGDIEVVVDAAESEIDVYIDSTPPGSVTEDSVSELSNKTLVDPIISAAIYDAAAAELLKFSPTASAVNEVTIANAATGAGPTISATGGDTNIDLILSGKGTGAVKLTSPKILTQIVDTNGNELIKLTAAASAVNEITLANAATGAGPTLSATGGDTNIDLNLAGKGSGGVKVGGYVVLTTNTGVTPAGAQSLSDKTFVSPKITGSVLDTNGNELITVTATASAVNEVTLANAATGNGPTLSATGGDTNIDLNLAGKGTGGVKAGGALVSTVGKQTINIPAGAWKARNTNGGAVGSVETTTNKLMINTLDFDAATVEYAQADVQMPASWDGGTVTAVFCWSHASTTTNFGVAWSLAGVALSDGDALDAARGTAQTVTDTGGTTNTLYITAETAAVTIAGGPAANDWVKFEIARQVANGSDTMAIDARLHSVQIRYTTDKSNDN